jgi:hypothetical protein
MSMKIKNTFLFVALFSALVSNAMADLTNYAVPLTANIQFFLESSGVPTNQFKADEMIRATLVATIPARYLNFHTNAGTIIADATNNVWYRGFPRRMSLYYCKLFNEKGQEVQKTEKGIANSEPPAMPKNHSDMYKNFGVGWTRSDLWVDYAIFRPDEIFSIQKKGIYELEFRAQIYVPMIYGVPDTNAMLDVHKVLRSENWSFVESSPLRVKVIKE